MSALQHTTDWMAPYKRHAWSEAMLQLINYGCWDNLITYYWAGHVSLAAFTVITIPVPCLSSQVTATDLKIGLQMIFSDLIIWQGTRIVAPGMATKQHSVWQKCIAWQEDSKTDNTCWSIGNYLVRYLDLILLLKWYACLCFLQQRMH